MSSSLPGPRPSDPLERVAALDRRQLLRLGGTGLLVAGLSSGLAACGNTSTAKKVTKIPERDDTKELTPREARKRLEEGNKRFVDGKSQFPDMSLARRKKLDGGQAPFAAVLSCVDSRVPPEMVFDQGLGDLFVARSAGQVLDDAVLGSLQFGVAEIGVPLIVVLGHTACGAVKATVEAIETKAAPSGTSVDALVEALKPAVMEAEEGGAEAEAIVDAAVANNVDRVVEELKAAKVISSAIKANKVRVIGAVYDLSTGEAVFA